MEDTNEVSYIVSERDFVSLLIDLYRNRPLLWKLTHKSYADKRARAQALDEIANELQSYKPDYTVEKLKKKINIIRTNFNKEKHRVEKWRAEGRSNAKPGLWYFNELLFLDDQDLPYNSSYRRASGASDVGDAGAVTDCSDDEKPFLEIEEEEQKSPQTITRSTKRQRTLSTPKSKRYRNVTVKRRRVEKPDTDTEDEENSEPEEYMTITTTFYKKPKKREDILAESWSKKLKRMSPEQKLFAEKIINDVLYEGELGNLTRNGVSFCS